MGEVKEKISNIPSSPVPASTGYMLKTVKGKKERSRILKRLHKRGLFPKGEVKNFYNWCVINVCENKITRDEAVKFVKLFSKKNGNKALFKDKA